MKRKMAVSVAELGIVATAATSAWAWTEVNSPNITRAWPITKVINVRQLTHNLPASQYKLRSDRYIGIKPLTTTLLRDIHGTLTGKVAVETAAYISCQDEPNLAFTKIQWDFGMGTNALSEDRTFAVPKTYGATGTMLGEFSVPCRTLAPGRAGTPANVGAGLDLKLTDTEGRVWDAFVRDSDLIVCPRKPDQG